MLIQVGGLTIDTHRSVLAARSPVFAAMLSAGMKEAHDKSIVITDLSSNAVQDLVVYLYTGQVDARALENDDSCLELLKAAHRFEVAALVRKCTDMLRTRLDIGNVCEWFKFADLLSIGKLKTQCLDFICDHIAEVQNSEAYSEICQPQLLKDIIARLHSPAKRQRTESGAS